MNWNPAKADPRFPKLPGSLFGAILAAGGMFLADTLPAQQFRFQQLPAGGPVAPIPTAPPNTPINAPTGGFNAGGGPLAPAGISQTSHSESRGLASAVYVLNHAEVSEFEAALVASGLATHHPAAGGAPSQWQISTPTTEVRLSVNRINRQVAILGQPELLETWSRCVKLMDQTSAGRTRQPVQFVALGRLKPEVALTSLRLMQPAAKQDPVNPVPSNPQVPAGNAQVPAVQRQDGKQDPAVKPPVTAEVPMGALAPRNMSQDEIISQLTTLQDIATIGNVTIQVVPELGMVIIKGDNQEDVDKVKAIINDIINVAGENQPQLKRIPLRNSEPTALATQVKQVYDDVYAANQGVVSVTPIADPRALLVAGSKESIATLEKIIVEYDITPEAIPETSNFKSYNLKYLTAGDAKQRIDEYFGQAAQQAQGTPPEAAPVVTIADYRSNSLIVKASPTYLAQVDQLLEALDVADTVAQKAVRVFRLKNTLASTVATVLQQSINGGMPNAPQGFNPNPQAQTLGGQAFGGLGQNGGVSSPGLSNYGSSTLSLVTVDADGKQLKSGILFDVRVNADATSNSLLVTAPQESMDLIAALIDQLDRIPDAETQIKVFQITNGDALTIFQMLQTLFQSQNNQGGGLGGLGGLGGGGQTAQLGSLPLQTASAGPGATLANLRFSVDQRTNTIIASGPVGDLQVIDDLLTRLDVEENLGRRTYVYRVANLSALDLADAVNAMLDSRRQLVTGVDPTSINDFTTARREVIVQPEAVGNSLIVNARPEYIDEVMEIIQALDRRPPMVKMKVLIAEVNLSMLEEFGADIGLQDSLLFDRGIGTIGFPFNQAGIGNNNTPASLATREALGSQALSNLGTGRANADLGYGGLVLSAGNESVNLLLRALKDKQCARVLSHPTVMTVEGQAGRIQVGAEVRFISGTVITNGLAQNNVEAEQIGVILEVTPRVSPDGMIVMRVSAVNSTLGPEAQGTTVGFGADGSPIRVPQILTTEAQTTIMSRHGQAVVFSGLIREEKTRSERGIPLLSDIPVLGNLFKFQSENALRSELLIILTPYLVDGDDDIETLNMEDMDRMHWCINDVAEIYGTVNYDQTRESYSAPSVYYPDNDPTGIRPETLSQPAFDEPFFESGTSAAPAGNAPQTRTQGLPGRTSGPAGQATQAQFREVPASRPAVSTASARQSMTANPPAATANAAAENTGKTGRGFQLPRIINGNNGEKPDERGFSRNPFARQDNP